MHDAFRWGGGAAWQRFLRGPMSSNYALLDAALFDVRDDDFDVHGEVFADDFLHFENIAVRVAAVGGFDDAADFDRLGVELDPRRAEARIFALNVDDIETDMGQAGVAGARVRVALGAGRVGVFEYLDESIAGTQQRRFHRAVSQADAAVGGLVAGLPGEAGGERQADQIALKADQPLVIISRDRNMVHAAYHDSLLRLIGARLARVECSKSRPEICKDNCRNI